MSTKTELWIPGKDLSDEYPTPSDDELAKLWCEYTGNLNTLPVKGLYGAYTEPDRPIKAIASVDVCEVLRDTVMAIDGVTGRKPERRTDYARGTWLADEKHIASGLSSNTITSMAHVLIGEGHVKPIENIILIKGILNDWRRRGIYTVANTSTLPGCEPGTIRHNLGRDVKGGFDAILFPRNYDGKGSLTKLGALTVLASELDIDLRSVPAAHIDDADHHVKVFKEALLEHPLLNLVVPVNADNAGKHPDEEASSSLEAFMRTNVYFRANGI